MERVAQRDEHPFLVYVGCQPSPPLGSRVELHDDDQLRGLISNLRGRMAEERVVRLLNESPDRPSWLLDARGASPDIDELGIDVVVVTRDLGPLPLQVKSSVDGAAIFRRRHPEVAGIVGVVVAPIEMADEEVWTAVMAELARLRDAARPIEEAQPSE